MNTAQTHGTGLTTVQVATAGEALIDLIEEADGRLRPVPAARFTTPAARWRCKAWARST
jgi:hypothetical protein